MNTVRTERVLKCIYCGGSGEALYENLPDNYRDVEGVFGIKRCPACSLLWLDPRPIPEDIMKCYTHFGEDRDIPIPWQLPKSKRPFGCLRDALRESILCSCFGYSSIHKWHLFCGLGKILGLIPLMRRKATYDIGGPFPRVPRDPGALFIDVGCGRGEYLFWLKRFGWKVLGIEQNPVTAQMAEKNGIPVIKKDFFEACLPDASADYVSMMHVIEHLFDPRRALRECWRILKPGGRLILHTPNALSFGHAFFRQYWYALDPPRHLFLFSPESIKRIFEDIPFRKVSVTSSATTDQNVYRSSMAVMRGEQLPLRNAVNVKGSCGFSFQERLRLFIGQKAGEELFVVAVK